MSTDFTSALDRALAELQATVADPDLMCSLSHEEARAVVAELRALRALAGAPTADVASEPVASNVRGAADWLLYFYADPSHQGEDDQTAAAYWALGDDLAGKLIDAFRELARLRAAAPEGVDAADEQDDDEGHGPWNYTEFGVLCSCGHPVDADERCTRPCGPEAEHEARVGALFEAADNLLTAWDRGDGDLYGHFDDLQGAVDELSKHGAEPGGPDLEAQGEMADQLAAAQAAIQRVREMCKPTGAHLLNKALFARDVLRALDGDTTEEQR